jgi:hypothetical protein
MNERFECILDPADRYVIWDSDEDIPVVRHGRVLSYSASSQGERIASVLNLAASAGLTPASGSWNSSTN